MVELFFGIMTVFMVIYAISVFFTRIFAKQFDAFYNSLSEIEKQKLEAELANARPGQNIILTEKAIIYINFIVISAYEYEEIRMIQKYVKKVMLHGDKGLIGVLICKRRDRVDDVMQEIIKKNENIRVGY